MIYYKGLDSLRALAVIAVLIGHWYLPINWGPTTDGHFWIRGLIPGAGFGVHLFFVLSGFLITNILLEARFNSNNSNLVIMKNFIARRTLRIFPIYYLTLIILYFGGYPFESDTLAYIAFYISNFKIYFIKDFFNWSHTWSLSVEEQFYLFWPWLILFVGVNKLKKLFIFTIISGFVFGLYFILYKQNWAGQFLTPTCMQAFAVGGLYAYLKRNNQLSRYKRPFQFAFIFSLIVFYQWSFHQEYEHKYNYFILLINSTISIGLIHLTINNTSKLWDKYFFKNNFINKIGRISYGIYLYHYAMDFLWNILVSLFFNKDSEISVFLLEWTNAYYFKLILLYFISLWSYKYIEKPIMTLKKHFNY